MPREPEGQPKQEKHRSAIGPAAMGPIESLVTSDPLPPGIILRYDPIADSQEVERNLLVVRKADRCANQKFTVLLRRNIAFPCRCWSSVAGGGLWSENPAGVDSRSTQSGRCCQVNGGVVLYTGAAKY